MFSVDLGKQTYTHTQTYQSNNQGSFCISFPNNTKNFNPLSHHALYKLCKKENEKW